MNKFIEKWNTDKRFQTKTKLSLYTLFVVLVALFAFSNYEAPTVDIDNTTDQTSQTLIDIPKEYTSTMNIKINEQQYQYVITKSSEKEVIVKTVNDNTSNYTYENNNYYKEENGTYVMTTKEEVYDIIGYNYINLETINQYLTKSTKNNDSYIVYLKDIILGNDSEDYITIKVDNNKVNADYTSLIKNFDNTIESYTLEVVIEEKE